MQWCLLLGGFLVSSVVESCTLIAAGKNTTLNGSTMIAHTDDAGGGAADLRLIRVEAKDYSQQDKSQRPVYNFHGGFPRVISNDRGSNYLPTDGQNTTVPLGWIPQVKHTYGYFDQDYGMMNDVQLAIGESTCSSRTIGWPSNLDYGYNLFGIAELSKIALERCDSARCAVQTMGDLAVTHGFFSEDSGSPLAPSYANGAETLAIADKYGEVWVFHVLTGLNNASAIWAAQRVPDDHLAIVANSFTIRQMDLNDRDNFLISPNATDIAQSMGWWNPTLGPFDFTSAFAFTTIGPLFPLYTGRRMWRVYDLVAPSLKLDATLGQEPSTPTYPFSVHPDTYLEPSQIMHILMDHYEGTPYDMTKGIAAGPFGSPVRFDGPGKNVTGGWERAISMFRTMFSYVLVSNGNLPDPVGGLVLYAQSSPHGSVYVPFSCAQNSVPASYLIGKESQFTTKSAWWAFDFVNNWSLLRYNIISPDIKAEQRKLQTEAFDHVHRTQEQALSMNNSKDMVAYLETENNAFASTIVQQWWTLAWSLVSKFSDGYAVTGEEPSEMLSPGYPKWFLETTSFSKWPGTSYNPPTLPGTVAEGSDAQATAPSPGFHVPSFLYGILAPVAIVGIGYVFYKFKHRQDDRKGYNAV